VPPKTVYIRAELASEASPPARPVKIVVMSSWRTRRGKGTHDDHHYVGFASRARSAAVMAQIHSSHCSNAIVCQGRNPSFCITRNERVFALIVTEISRSRPSTSKATSPAEYVEGDIAAHQGRLGGEAATPRVPGQPPADLHLVGQHAMVRQTAEAEQLTGLSRGNGVQPVSAFLPCALGLPEDRVTLSAGQWAAADMFGDLRIGVDLSERRRVSRLPWPQDQPSRLDPGRTCGVTVPSA
jgi:hypothetical protein